MPEARPRVPAASLAAAVAVLAAAGAARSGDGPARREADIRAALERTFAFDYVDTPLVEIVRDIAARAGVEIVLDPEAFDWGAGAAIPVTWSSKRSSAARALRWVTRLCDLGFRIEDGAVFVSTPRNLRGEPALRTYDVRDLVRESGCWPGPVVAFSPAEAREAEFVMPSSIADLVMSRVAPTTWGADLGTSIEERDGLLIANQTPDVHELMAKLLSELRAGRERPVRVDVAVLTSSAALPVVGKARDATLAPEEVEAILRRTGEDALVARGSLSMIEGRKAHAVWGAKTHYVESRGLQWPEVETRKSYDDELRYEVVPYGDVTKPKVLVVKTPRPKAAQPPPGKGVLVPEVDALLDGMLVEATARLEGGDGGGGRATCARLDLRVVISHPHGTPAAGGPGGEAVSTPVADYSRLETTTRLPVGSYALVGRLAVRRGARDVPAVVLARVSLPEGAR